MARISRAQNYRERAKGLRKTAARMSGSEVRNDMENIALQYELVAERIEPVERKRRGRKPKL